MEQPPEARPLPDPPTDGVTSLSYLPAPASASSSSSILASTSWDGAVRLHDTSAMSQLVQRNMESGPLLSLATPSGGGIITGGLDGSVRSLDVERNAVQSVGSHTGEGASPPPPPGAEERNAVSCLSALDGTSVVASAGWDSTFYLWDVRAAAPGSRPAARVKLPGKAFSMDSVGGNRVAVATAGRRTVIIDVRATSDDASSEWEAEVKLERESSLKYQTRVARFFPGGRGLAVGSIEGRVAVEFLDELGVDAGGKKKYAFKCHRVGDTVYPVNAIAFHPKFGTFATGGCDGSVVTWDGLNKKKLSTLPKFATSVAALAFNHDGSELAVASSYTFEEGEREHPRDEIFVRRMLDSECKPKSKQ